jgi:polyhydroxyalkanoate synthesis regulator protein
MLNIKKYANGRFFDTAAKEYIKPEIMAEMIKKGEKIQVTLAKTGKDITDAVIAQFSKKEERKQAKEKKDIPFLKTDKMTKWLGEIIEAKIEKVMDIIKLPSRDQVARLDENIKELNRKIDALQLSHGELSHGKAAGNKTNVSDIHMPSHAAFEKSDSESGNRNNLAAVINTAS